ncbi:hypothetical protein VCB98_03850 [Gammaproteobacteria bacterium AB-CW1]|uniref:Uncharacterized protein n=1 Tax=Natronospira elongata TaxID=3110268 RepID=A0AAP6JF26_9GAMM|nr:hypothetical protein [Gammaproteobacteria bacterium AB-CW1]
MDTGTMLLEAAVLFFIIVGLLAAALGLILMLAPDGFQRMAEGFNRQWSTRRAMRELELPRYYERFFYRHHRWAGGLILLAALWFFFGFVLHLSPAEAAGALPGIPWIWEALFWFLIVANAAAAVIALVILLRPSALKPLEKIANHWVSVRQATRKMEESDNRFDDFARRHHRATGFILVLAGVFLMVSFGVILGTGGAPS